MIEDEEVKRFESDKLATKTCALCDEEDEGPEIKLVSGAFQIGKVEDSCEDAYFITNRGFGIADGVSGWNDYGFSSMAFAHSLMDNSKKEIEHFIEKS
jgi:hypothetical protein